MRAVIALLSFVGTAAAQGLTAHPSLLTAGGSVSIAFDVQRHALHDDIRLRCGSGPGDLAVLPVMASASPVTDIIVSTTGKCPTDYVRMPIVDQYYPPLFYPRPYLFFPNTTLCITDRGSKGPISGITGGYTDDMSAAKCDRGEILFIDPYSVTNNTYLCVERGGEDQVNFIVTPKWAWDAPSSEVALKCPGSLVPVTAHSMDLNLYFMNPNKENSVLLCLQYVSSPRASVRFDNLPFMRCNYTATYVRSGVDIHTITLQHRSSRGSPSQVHLSVGDSSSQMRVQWNNDFDTESFVEFGLTPTDMKESSPSTTSTYTSRMMCGFPAAFEHQYAFRNPGFTHTATLNGLLPATKYYYRVGNKVTSWSQTFSFISAPSGEEEETVMLGFADFGLYYFGYSALSIAQQAARDVLERLAEGKPTVVLLTGDISYAMSRGYLWDAFGEVTEAFAARSPFMLAIGNHDYDHVHPAPGGIDPSGETGNGFHPTWGNYLNDSYGECSVPVVHRYTSPQNGNGIFWYSYNWGLVHVLTVSSEHNFTTGSPLWEFMKADLAAVNRSLTPWVVVNLHRMAYSSQTCQGDDFNVSLALRSELDPLYEKFKVNLVLEGHQHSYERSCPILFGECYDQSSGAQAPVHIVAGSAGATKMECGFDERQYGNYSVVHENNYGFLRLRARRDSLKVQYFLYDQPYVVNDEVVLENYSKF